MIIVSVTLLFKVIVIISAVSIVIFVVAILVIVIVPYQVQRSAVSRSWMKSS